MLEEPVLWLAVPSFLLVAWYVLGNQYNTRLAGRALQWLQKGLPLLGEKATVQRIGTNTVELKIVKGIDPFRSAELIVVLESRGFAPLWWWRRSRGRRDLFIFRSQLRAAPHFDLEARTKEVKVETPIIHNGSGKWTPVQGGIANDMLADYRGGISPFSINRLIVHASLDGLALKRLAVHRTVPNLEVQFLLPQFSEVSPPRVFTSLRQLSEEILKL